MRLGDRDGAIQALERSVELDENSPESRSNLGALLALQGDPERALAELNRATELNAQLPDPYKYRGNIFFRTGDAVQAIENYSRYLQLDPEADDSAQVQSLIDLLSSVEEQPAVEDESEAPKKADP